VALAGALALTACADDGSTGDDVGGPSADASGSTTTVAPATTTTEAIPVDTTFLAEDPGAVCGELDGLRDIDPEADPSQADVNRLLDIASRVPVGVAEPLRQVAAYGQAVVDGEAEAELRTTAVEAATVLIAYGNEACAIDVPLFDAIAGV
jgi:hypothetical protein